MADVVQVEVLSDGKDYLDAARVTFVKAGTPEERADIIQHPEWSLENSLALPAVDPNNDDRRLSTVLQEPPPRDSDITILRRGRNQLREVPPSGMRAQTPEDVEDTAVVPIDPTIRAVRKRVKAFMEVLPNLIVKKDTSMFVSFSRPPNGLRMAMLLRK